VNLSFREYAMSVRFLAILVVTLALAGSVQAQASKPGKPVTPPAPTETTELIRTLQERIESKNLIDPIPLNQAMQFLHEQLAAKGKELPILINTAAFRMEGMPDVANTEVALSAIPKQHTVQAILDQTHARVEATYLLRQGRIEIVPISHATIEHLLTQPILARYEQRPLQEVLQDLADLTGATIVLDARGGESAKEPITATLRNSATLEDALRMSVEAAGLKFVVLRSSIYVTTPANARAIQQEQNDTPAPAPRVGRGAPAAI